MRLQCLRGCLWLPRRRSIVWPCLTHRCAAVRLLQHPVLQALAAEVTANFGKRLAPLGEHWQWYIVLLQHCFGHGASVACFMNHQCSQCMYL